MGDVDLGEHLSKYRGREMVLIIASVGEAGKERVICGICGFVLDEVGECPRCIEARQEMREALFREVGEILERGQDESG